MALNVQTSPASLEGGRAHYVRRERFEIDQYVRVQVSETRFAIGVVTAINEDQDKATVETRNGYEVTLPISALRRAFLVVLDLNGVLVARGRGSFILRPHVLDFLKFVFSNFVVAVWTSGLQRSSNPIIDHVFGSYRDLLLFTLFRDACVPKASQENPYGTEKNLQVIFDRYPQSFHAVNTIIIDDSPDKCSHPDIALCPIPFKDPVAQSQDGGLLETMETLRQVLVLDSGAPLIHAAEERLQKLAEQQQVEQTPSPMSASGSHADGATPTSVATTTTTAATTGGVVSPTAADTPQPLNAPLPGSPPSDMEEVELWKTRLCCENLLEKCPRGEQCPFSHDADDGRPCSRKNHCRFHGVRWPKTSEESEREAQKRLMREAKQRQYQADAERRQHLLEHRASAETQQHPQRQRGGRQRPPRGGRHREEGLEDEADWASCPTGFSHTGDPAYDRMIDEQQRRNSAQTAARGGNASGGVGASLAAPLPSSSPAFTTGGVRGGGYGSQPAHAAAAAPPSRGGESVGTGSRGQNSFEGNPRYGSQRGSQDYRQQQQQQHTHEDPFRSGVGSPLSLFFQSAVTPTAAATASAPAIEPFSTRPIAPPATPPQQQQQQQQQQHVSLASLMAMQTPEPRSRAGNQQGGDRGRQQSNQSQQAIRIRGQQGDSNAVVNQLQALLRQQ